MRLVVCNKECNNCPWSCKNTKDWPWTCVLKLPRIKLR